MTMQRKEFLIKSGAIITASMLLNYWRTEAKLTNPMGKGREDLPQQAQYFDQPILKCISHGLSAPNPHNTQAWKFKIVNKLEAYFYVDKVRLLPAADPFARQIHIGCGGLIALFKIAATQYGYHASVRYLPEGPHGLQGIGKLAVAHLSLKKTKVNPGPLFSQIAARQTSRLPYTGDLVTSVEFKKIVSMTQPGHSEIGMINTTRELDTLLPLLYQGMVTECFDFAVYDESRRWFRVKDDIKNFKDGTNLHVNGVKGIKLWIAEAVLNDYSTKSWHSKRSIQSYLQMHQDAVMSSKGVVTFKTMQNAQLDWVKCGEDYARFQLAATSLGFFMQPLSQVLQEFASIQQLREDFDRLMGVVSPQKIQMVARIGRGKRSAHSLRRNTQDFIVNI